jgi:hypothetical protein
MDLATLQQYLAVQLRANRISFYYRYYYVTTVDSSAICLELTWSTPSRSPSNRPVIDIYLSVSPGASSLLRSLENNSRRSRNVALPRRGAGKSQRKFYGSRWS